MFLRQGGCSNSEEQVSHGLVLNYKTGVACGANAMRKVFPRMYSQPRGEPNRQRSCDYKAPFFPKQGRTSNPHLQTTAASRSRSPNLHKEGQDKDMNGENYEAPGSTPVLEGTTFCSPRVSCLPEKRLWDQAQNQQRPLGLALVLLQVLSKGKINAK